MPSQRKTRKGRRRSIRSTGQGDPDLEMLIEDGFGHEYDEINPVEFKQFYNNFMELWRDISSIFEKNNKDIIRKVKSSDKDWDFSPLYKVLNPTKHDIERFFHDFNKNPHRSVTHQFKKLFKVAYPEMFSQKKRRKSSRKKKSKK